jgi:hypothetical protein
MKSSDLAKLEEDIFDFILFSQALCQKAKDIFGLVKTNKPAGKKEESNYINDSNVHLLQLTGNLFMNQCLLELGSLLDNNERQKSLSEILKAKGIKGNAITELNAIAMHFKDKHLLVIRHQFIAHRGKGSSGGPDSIIYSTYKNEIITDCEIIINEIIEFWVKYIGPRPGNNMFLDKLEKIDEAVKLLLNNTNGVKPI